ncbi:MAG: D-alanyl-D-alanine carboxypeptidase/D-alanyl-D-alanine endopeptidase [Saprospiraceae bacterium]
MKKLTLFILIIIVGLQKSSAQNYSALNKAISAFVSDQSLSHAGISICVIDAGTGLVVASHNPELSLTPASSMKVVTTGAALGMMGPDYTFKTELQYDGQIDPEEGILYGNLYIKGFGDPTLGTDHIPGILQTQEVMDTFGKEVEKQNICSINGRIIGDGTFFSADEAIGSNWQWDDIGNSYGAGAYGLNINENQYSLLLQQNTVIGSAPKIIGSVPFIPEISFVNQLITGPANSPEKTNIYTAPYNDEVIVRGTIPAGTNIIKIEGAMPDPPYAAAYYFNEMLKNRFHVQIKRKPLSITDLKLAPKGSRKTFFTFSSPKLTKIVEEANQESNNMFVEALLRAIAKFQNEEGTPTKGCEVVMNYWKSKGIDLNGFFMEDGSGLSSRSAVSSHQLASILQQLNSDPIIGPAFYESLPKAGESGTLKSMFKKSAALGKLRAKSGSMTRVRSYTGYIDKKDGTRLCFSMIVNNFTCNNYEMKAKMEQLMIRFCE